MTENYFEYAVEEKNSGKNRLLRTVLILFYILYSAAFFLVFYLLLIPQIIALLPFTLLIIVPITWRYVSVTHEYIISTGEISFAHIYANRKRKEVIKLPIRELCRIEPGVNIGRGGKESFFAVYDFRSSPDSPDAYRIVYKDQKDRSCLIWFEATKKALKLMRIYNPNAVVGGQDLRY